MAICGSSSGDAVWLQRTSGPHAVLTIRGVSCPVLSASPVSPLHTQKKKNVFVFTQNFLNFRLGESKFIILACVGDFFDFYCLNIKKDFFCCKGGNCFFFFRFYRKGIFLKLFGGRYKSIKRIFLNEYMFNLMCLNFTGFSRFQDFLLYILA